MYGEDKDDIATYAIRLAKVMKTLEEVLVEEHVGNIYRVFYLVIEREGEGEEQVVSISRGVSKEVEGRLTSGNYPGPYGAMPY